MSIRTDRESGRSYTYHNIPVDKKGHCTSVQNSKGFFKIFSENHNHPEDSWYNGRFIGDRYAVFKWVNTTPSTGFYQQVTPWYYRFGYAVNRLLNITREA